MAGKGVRSFTIRFERAAEGGYVVTVPELPGCVTEGDTFAEALEMVKDAMAGWLYVAAKYGDPVPPVFQDVVK
ncbi:MAG: type II toxin-antitoxin system HicB family antitoxin, partial [Chloroflexi bacterium]|nr:type II toxin-antitoxin system HicB family antitoxin [Chloroflexota bacterium]